MSHVAPVIVYTGHMFEHGAAAERELILRIAETLDELGAYEAFGSLACGGDILIAEGMLARGGTLHAVLPFAEPDFIAQSVVCGGEHWMARFTACRNAAESLHFSTPGAYVDDDNQFAYGTRFAMGLAALRARDTGGEAVQLAIITPGTTSFSSTGLAGTAADTRAWEKLGLRTVTIEHGGFGRNLEFPPRSPPCDGAAREIRSILFADYKGFSAVGEGDLPLFMDQVMGRVGETLDRFGAHIEFSNTWGDALYAIIDRPDVAANVALALQERLAELPDALSGEGAGMRIGLHYGPVWRGNDRVTRTPLWYGSEVNRTARIEPVTPVGGVYCTETFASALLLEGHNVQTILVGRKPLAKGFGDVVLYRLEART
jgi:class 3 adenylate cyclase